MPAEGTGPTLKGTLAAALTPLRDGGTAVDTAAIGPYVDFLAAGGVDGIFAPLQQPPGKAPSGPVRVTYEEQSPVGTLHHAHGPDPERRCHQPNRRQSNAKRQPPEL